MPSQIIALQVFIASPSGLSAERSAFGAEINEYNQEIGRLEGVMFVPMAWEFLPSSSGRPQATINEGIRNSDFFLLVLWDRWGSPTGVEDYSSGVDEEYSVARTCLQDGEAPLRDIAVLFKGVDERQLSDPGAQLQRVLEFRSRLEDEKSLLFAVFDSESEFRREVRRLLTRWSRSALLSDEPEVPNPPAVAHASTSDAPRRSDLALALRSAQAGRRLEAEQRFSKLVTETASAETLSEYARFLRHSGRYAQARRVSKRVLRMAQQSGDLLMMVRALSSLGVVARKEGRLDEAVRHLEQARSIAGDLDLSDTAVVQSVCYALDNFALTLRRRGDLRAAAEMIEESLTLRRAVDDPAGRARSLNNLGVIQREMGQLDAAVASHSRALELGMNRLDSPSVYESQSHLGSAKEELGELEEAAGLYREALQGARAAESLESISINLGKLAQLEIGRHQWIAATAFAMESVEMNEREGNEEGSATGLLLLGQCALGQERLDEASSYFEQALDRFSDLGQTHGRAQCLIGLATVDIRAGRVDMASDRLEGALDIAGVAPRTLRRQLAGLEEELKAASREADGQHRETL